MKTNIFDAFHPFVWKQNAILLIQNTFLYFLLKFHLGCNIPLHIPLKQFWIISYSHRKSRKWNFQKWMLVYYKQMHKEEVLNQISRGKETQLRRDNFFFKIHIYAFDLKFFLKSIKTLQSKAFIFFFFQSAFVLS